MGTSSTDSPAGNNRYNPVVIGMPRTDSEQNQRTANYMPTGFGSVNRFTF